MSEDKRASKKATWDQEDVLKHKDGVTQSGRGLQIWGDELAGATGTGHHGTGSQGTAERAANITAGQDAYDTKKSGQGASEEESDEGGDAVNGSADRSAEQPT